LVCLNLLLNPGFISLSPENEVNFETRIPQQMKRTVLLFFCFSILFTAFCQQKVVADKIAGIVGDKIILKSEIFVANSDIVRQGGQSQDDCTLLDGMLTQKALVLQAEKDSIPVTDEEVDAEIDQQIRYFISMYGTKEALEQIAGRSIYQIKDDFKVPFREKKLAVGMRNKIVNDIKITPTEVKDFFDKIPKDSLLYLESQYQIGQIVIYPKASRDIELLAIDELTDYKKQVESGAKKFETLARLYSDDPGTKDKGGQMDINRSDKLDPNFLAAAFRLKDGQISPIVKSKYGYHIIQMINRAGDDASIAEILRIPQITQAETDEAVTKLDSVRQLLVAGTMSFGEAVVKYSDDEIAKYTAGRMLARDGSTFLTIDNLDKDMVLLLKNSNLKAGEYSKPTLYTDERGKKAVRIIQLVSKSDPHKENLRDDYNMIAQKALDEKKEMALQKWFASKISTYYIMIDDEYKNCNNLVKWQTKTATARN
jgi:peptidyl-prolyl cis-trans isomerase SurA